MGFFTSTYNLCKVVVVVVVCTVQRETTKITICRTLPMKNMKNNNMLHASCILGSMMHK